MIDIFHSAKLRLSRAKEHLIDLNDRIKAFFDAKPYKLVVESDSNGWIHAHKIKFTKPFPDDFAVVAADVVDNLRSALDQSWFAIAIISRVIKSSGKAYFPFADNASDFDSVLRRGCKNFPHDILTLLRTFKPYKGGNDLLWALNRICATNKHEMLAPTSINVNMGFSVVKTRKGRTEIITPKWNRRDNEIIYFITFKDDEIDYHIPLALDIAFDKVEIVAGQPAVAVLNRLAGEVENILLALEREIRRLGFV
jgi:hypothetical protein